MRRIFLVILCVCPLLVLASNTLSLSSASGHPSDIVTIEASMSGTEDVVACEWRIPLGQYLSYVPNSTVLNTARSNGHSITAASYNDTLIVSIYSISLKPIVGTEGVLFSFKLTLGREPATYALKPEVLLSDENGSSVSSFIQSGAVTILSPKISVITLQVDFGHIPIRNTYTKTLQVQNVGNEDLHISDVFISAEALSLPQFSWTIAAGQTQSIALTYKPIIRGAISETIRFRSDAINDADVFQANKVSIIADPFSVNELHVAGASGISDDTVTISLRVNNMEPLVGVQCSFVLPNELIYVENSAAISARCSQHSLLSSIEGDILTFLLYSMQNDTLGDNDGEIFTFRLRLNGTSGSYPLEPIDVMLSNIKEENMTSAVYGDDIQTLSPRISAVTSINFGNTPITETVTAHYSIRNQGNANLRIERINFLSEGFAISEPLPFDIPEGQTRAITISYNPIAEGDYHATMQIYSNDPEARMLSLALFGHIYEPNELTMSGEQLDDGEYHIHVDLANYTPIVGAQMDFHSIKGTTPILVPSARLANHTCIMMPNGEKDYRILIYSLNNEPIDGSNGSLFDIVYPANDSAVIQAQIVTIDSIYLSDIENKQRLTGSILMHIIGSDSIPDWGTVTLEMNCWSDEMTEEEKENIDGYAIGCGECPYGTTVTIWAVVNNPDFCFSQWSDGNTSQTREITLISDTAIYAEFDECNQTNTYMVFVNFDSEAGYVYGMGEYEEGEWVALYAEPNSGYQFAYWSDGSTENPYEFNIYEDITLEAYFCEDEETSIDNTCENIIPEKLFLNGQILILRGDKTYTITGQEVR